MIKIHKNIKKKNKFRLATRFGTLILATTMLITMSGCGGEQVLNYVNEDLRSSIDNRVRANIDLVGQLKSDGLISQKTHDNIVKSLEKNQKSLEEKFDKILKQARENPQKIADLDNDLTNGISSFAPITPELLQKYRGTTIINDDKQEEIDVSGASYDTLKNLCLVNSLYTGGSATDIKGVTLHSHGEDCNRDVHANHTAGIYFKENVTPITLIADDSLFNSASKQVDSIQSEINEKFNWPVYVLKSEIVTSNGDGSLDGVMEIVKESITAGKDGTYKVSTGELANYFEKATDKNGKDLTLLDMSKEENQIVKESVPQDLFNAVSSKPGYDMVVKQWDVPTMTLRFKEFSWEAYDRINSLVGVGNECKFIFCSSGDKGHDQNRVYLMEYPVYYLSKLQHKSDEEVSGTLSKSGIGINLYTGKTIKYNQGEDGKWLASGKAVSEATDQYLTTDGASSNDDTGKSAFIVKGVGNADVSVEADGTKKTALTGRVILRDYLEATFAPEFVEDENLVVFGRKIRLRFNDWDEQEYTTGGKTVAGVKQYAPVWKKDSKAAIFVDKEGNEISTSADLYITDFCGSGNLLKEEYKDCSVKTLASKGETDSKIKASLKKDSTPTITDLKQVTLGKDSGKTINPTVMFPSEKIGEVDYKSDTDEKQRFYCLTTRSGLFDTALFSDWINSTASTASLDWWNGYLLENGFKYSVGHEEVNTYLTSNYAYELSKDGVVILDLETVSKIQEQFDDDKNSERLSFIRTIFMMFGWILIVYSSILMLAWVVDTNTDAGLGLLTKLTFGNWIGIKYEDDMPYNNPNDQSFLTGGKMFIRSMIIITVGILLIRVNVFDIVIRLIQLFGNAAVEIEKIIKGI